MRCALMNRPSRSIRTLRSCGSRAHAPIDVCQKRVGLSSARSYFSRAPVGAIPYGATARSTGSRSRPSHHQLAVRHLDHDLRLHPHHPRARGEAMDLVTFIDAHSGRLGAFRRRRPADAMTTTTAAARRAGWGARRRPARSRKRRVEVGDPAEWPEDVRVREFPRGNGKGSAGRVTTSVLAGGALGELLLLSPSATLSRRDVGLKPSRGGAVSVPITGSG
jgi:hypothetical protein